MAVPRVIDGRHSRAILALLVVTHLVVISRQVDTGGGVSLLERAGFALLAPLQTGVARVVAFVSAAWHGYFDLRGVREENVRLRDRVRDLESAMQRSEQLAQEGARLRGLLALREDLPAGTLAAEVVGRGNLPWFHTFVIDKGSESGVKLNAPVVTPEGLVGHVVVVGYRASKVQALLDQRSGVGVLIERTRVAGVVSGLSGPAEAASSELLLKYVPARASVVAGDVLISSGQDRLYPKGLPVGRISAVRDSTGLFQDIRVAPAVSFESLEAVLVIPPAEQAPPLEDTP